MNDASDTNRAKSSETARSDGDGGESGGAGRQALRERIIEAIKTCYDPEIPVDIWELGLVYDIAIGENHDVVVTMTLTSPACPVAGSLPGEVEQRVSAVEGVATCRVDVTWDPPWTPDRMSELARMELNL